MSVAIKDRPIESIREEVIDQLIMNYSHGELSLEAFESRLDLAMDSSDGVEVKALTDDLPLSVNTDYQDKKKHALGTHYQHGEGKSSEKITNILSSNKRGGVWHVPKEIIIFNLLGDNIIDFTQARFINPNVSIKLKCTLGNVKILVPEDVNVHVGVDCIVGSINNLSNADIVNDAPSLTIEGKVTLGNLDIKMQRPMKEKWLRFADSLKALFN